MKGRRGGDSDLLRTFTLNRLIECLQRVCEAVAYAHERKVAHLDLNPTNIIVGGFGEVTVIDWSESLSSMLGKPPVEEGGGREVKKDTTSIIVGTPTYAAPEQLSGSDQKEGCPSDIHALGAILYEMLTDRPPYVRDTIEGTIEALRRGIVTPPEVASPRSGIDPTLSDLCVRALDTNPSKRPGAVEFAESLGRYVRSEAHWEVVKFGPDDHPVTEDEWTAVLGTWQLDGDTWTTTDRGDRILVWNVPLYGAHRFICEGWVEGNGELALVTHGPSPETAGGDYYKVIDEGYFFQFGAEVNTCSKLTRRGHDVMARPAFCLEPGRHYRIEMSYQDGWLHCFVDGKLVFEYRELFPLTGRHVGFYGYGTGTHLRPLELHREAWGLKAPVMRTADDLLRQGYYGAALKQYGDIAANIPHRLEGDEAQLKRAICLVHLGKRDEARGVLRELKGSQLEPFALAEEAMLDFRDLPDVGDPGRGAELFHQLHRRFPKSQAKARILEVVREIRWNEYLKDGNTLTRDLEIRAEITKLGTMTFEPPVLSQIYSARILVTTLMGLGRWSEALAEVIRFRDQLRPEQHAVHRLMITQAEAALANGREDYIPGFVAGEAFWSLADLHRCLDIPIHTAVRIDPEGAASFYETQAARIEQAGEKGDQGACKRYLLWCLVNGDLEGAEWTVARNVESVNFGTDVHPNQFVIRNMSYIVTASRQEPLMDIWMDRLEREIGKRDNALHVLTLKYVAGICRARWALEGGDPDGAAEVLEGMAPPPRTIPFTDGVLLQVMLSSLGKLKSPGDEELAEASEMLLAGTALDLARMFRGEKDPVPGELWPHHLFQPEWRLWLALWFEVRGDADKAREMAESVRDTRFGMANCQPAIEALLERTG
ncbi:tetratricopeptide repeat protein [Planctomycetota bacterium]